MSDRDHDAASSSLGATLAPAAMAGARRRVGRVVRRFRPRPPVPSPIARRSDDLRFLFRPSADRWYVDDGERWYDVDGDDVDALLTLMPLEVVDESRTSSVGSTGGVARVVDDDGPGLELLSPFGETIRRRVGLLPGLREATVRWVAGAHDDGWVEMTAALHVDGARRCVVEVYLPPHDRAPDKELAVQLPSGRRTVVDVHHLVRGEATRVTVLDVGRPVEGTTLVLQSSYPEPADDERPLGFVVAGLEAYA